MDENIIMIDENDNEIGSGNKMHIHKEGILHRAFSIFIFNSQGQMLIQKRSRNKYHSGGLWTNTCCSHPRIGENIAVSTHRRLKEEMGFDCELKRTFCFTYFADLDNGFIENELDHVFVGFYDGELKPNVLEVEDWKWVSPEGVKIDIKQNPDCYSHWFKLVAERAIDISYNKK
ncbi:isopentenyl-diphosphate delta-isomerase [Desulfosporosinus sp. Tol-M]|nr:isopentenyl-diphosphate delta-isomerase [Desulfosporosinus sp. Tol-M]